MVWRLGRTARWAAVAVALAGCQTLRGSGEGPSPGEAPTALEALSARRSRAEHFRRVGLIGLALTTMTELRDEGALTLDELEILARMQAYAKQEAEAYRTLDEALRRKPDVLRYKLLEVELMVLTGKELKAAELMDRLVADFPDAPGPRVQRARYFLLRNRPAMARADLDRIQGEEAQRPEVLELRYRVEHAGHSR